MEPCSVSDSGPEGGRGAVIDVADWLRTLGLERYEAAFRENDVSAEILRDLTADDLKDLGVTSIGHRRQLLVAIDQLRDDGMRSQAAAIIKIRQPSMTAFRLLASAAS
jgi:SAM domain (Sterile alpha motif)